MPLFSLPLLTTKNKFISSSPCAVGGRAWGERHALPQRTREFGWRLIRKRAMRPLAVVVAAPLLNFLAGVAEMQKPIHIQALVPQLAVKTLNMCILNRLAGLNVADPDPLLLRPFLQIASDELWPVVYSNGSGC